MATYVPALKGYVTDVPELWLKRRDEKVFHFDQLSSSNVSPDTQFTEVNGGWSLYPVAYLPGQSTMEMTFESAQFDAELFSLATNTEFKDDVVEVWGHATVTVDEANQDTYVIETDKSLTGAKLYINGFLVARGVEGGASVPFDSTQWTYGYEEASMSGVTNPKTAGLYELNLTEDSYAYIPQTIEVGDSLTGTLYVSDGDGGYELTDDVTAQADTVYYKKELKAEEYRHEQYELTTDETVDAEKTYYTRVAVPAGSEGIALDALTNEQKAGVNTVAGFNVGASEIDASTGVYKTRIILADPSGLAVGDQIDIDYCTEETLSTIQVDNQQTFVGEAMLKWPVYSSGEEVKAAGVKGYMLMHIYKCRCTAMPGFDTSYKSAVTNGITVSAMDPHRADGAIYSMSFMEKAA